MRRAPLTRGDKSVREGRQQGDLRMRTKAIKVKTSERAGGLGIQHSRRGMKIHSGVRAGGLGIQHNRKQLAG